MRIQNLIDSTASLIENRGKYSEFVELASQIKMRPFSSPVFKKGQKAYHLSRGEGTMDEDTAESNVVSWKGAFVRRDELSHRPWTAAKRQRFYDHCSRESARVVEETNALIKALNERDRLAKEFVGKDTF